MTVDHAITLDSGLNWRLICAHGPDKFYSADEDGWLEGHNA